MGEPLETTEPLEGVVGRGGRLICKGFVVAGEFEDVSIPRSGGRLDGNEGGWRDMT